MTREVYLFGAGASAFSTDVRPAPPPIGDHAFEALRKACPTWAKLSDSTAQVFRAHRFEAGMAQVVGSRPELLSLLLQEMGAYFLQFAPGPRNLYRALVAQLSPGPVCLATLNYDMLLEDALAEKFGGTGLWCDDTAPGVLKLHGGAALVPVSNERISKVALINEHGALTAGPCLPLGRLAAAEYWALTQGSLAPAMALYARGKRVPHSPDVVGEIQRVYRVRCEEAERIYLFGLRCVPEDWHVWAPLVHSEARVVFANPDQAHCGEFAAWSAALGLQGRTSIWPVGFGGAVQRRWPFLAAAVG